MKNVSKRKSLTAIDVIMIAGVVLLALVRLYILYKDPTAISPF